MPGRIVAAAMSDSNKGDARDSRLSGPQNLRHREREHVRKVMAAEARDKCWETRDIYVACAKGGPIKLLCRQTQT